MANSLGGTFSRRSPDVVTEELATVLSKKTSYEFKPLFELVHENLRASNKAHGGEEMLRLRVYEKLQALVSRGIVKRTVTAERKQYRGVAAPLQALNSELKSTREAWAKNSAKPASKVA